MKVILREQQILILESNYESWGCNLFPDKSEAKEWCENAKEKIRLNPYKKNIQNQIDHVGLLLKKDPEVTFQEKVKFYKENDPFFKKNVEDFVLAQELISPSCDKSEEAFRKEKEKYAKKFLFVDKLGEKYTYNNLSKLNSNFTALSYLLTKFREKNGLKGETFEIIFKNYFETPSNENLPKESEFVNFIFEYFSGKEEATSIMNDVLKTIQGTTDIGNKTEGELIPLLKKHFGEKNVKVFSGEGSFVDNVGIDVLVFDTEIGGWVPTQIKTSIAGCKNGNSKFCKNVCIGKNKFKNYRWELKVYDGENLTDQGPIEFKDNYPLSNDQN
jgi:hypothetical protein